MSLHCQCTTGFCHTTFGNGSIFWMSSTIILLQRGESLRNAFYSPPIFRCRYFKEKICSGNIFEIFARNFPLKWQALCSCFLCSWRPHTVICSSDTNVEIKNVRLSLLKSRMCERWTISGCITQPWHTYLMHHTKRSFEKSLMIFFPKFNMAN